MNRSHQPCGGYGELHRLVIDKNSLSRSIWLFLHGLKICAFILACIVLGLSFMPCSDGMSLVKTKKNSTESVKSLPGQNEHEDACSPFCHCSCCAGCAYVHHMTELSAIPSNFPANYPVYSTAQIISISFAIWQPPQVAA